MYKLLQDNIVDILTYLPVKSLIRFKCACKSWWSLISDPQFAKQHLKRGEEENNGVNRERLLVATEPLYSVDFEAASDGNNHNAIVELQCPNSVSHGDSFSVGMFLGSCNGLVCILDQVDDMVLWNPSTRGSKVLPKPSSSFHKDFSTGLGYDPSVDDYKIVIASTTTANGPKRIAAEISTLKTNTWRMIQGIRSGVILGGYYQGLFLNGALHWLGKQESGLAKVDVIVSFDVAEEKFMEFVPLPIPPNHFRTASLGLSGNRLCLFGDGCPNESCFEAWIATERDIKQSWRRLFSVPGNKVTIDYCTAVMCLTKNGELLLDRGGCPGILEFHNPEKDARKLIRVQHSSDPFYESAIYTESLFPVNDVGACDC